MVCTLQLVWASLKSCSDDHEVLTICLKEGDLYKSPLPTLISSDLYLVEIIDIDEDKNSVSIQVDLWTYWKDQLISSSNTSRK